jgi:predicted naringenin-chalcone synthase
MVYLWGFRSLDPPFLIPQDRTIRWLESRHNLHPHGGLMARAFQKFSVKPQQISKRGFYYPEIMRENPGPDDIFSLEKCEDMGLKSDAFSESTQEIFKTFYPTKESLPDHLIHVTCTGYIAPSPPQIRVSTLSGQTKITHAYHMGCYGAMPGIRMAQGFAQEDPRIDIVHTELCTLHMNPRDHSPEQMVIQSLFADGIIRYQAGMIQPFEPHFKVLTIREDLVPDSTGDMGWKLEKWGFAMKLSKDVPQKILGSLDRSLDQLAAQGKRPKEELIRRGIFAIHPGGPKIINTMSSYLDLTEKQTASSQKVLYERGNMSSATLPHVWLDILQNPPPPQTPIISLAFGPGLTIFASLMIYGEG